MQLTSEPSTQRRILRHVNWNYLELTVISLVNGGQMTLVSSLIELNRCIRVIKFWRLKPGFRRILSANAPCNQYLAKPSQPAPTLSNPPQPLPNPSQPTQTFPNPPNIPQPLHLIPPSCWYLTMNALVCVVKLFIDLWINETFYFVIYLYKT